MACVDSIRPLKGTREITQLGVVFPRKRENSDAGSRRRPRGDTVAAGVARACLKNGLYSNGFKNNYILAPVKNRVRIIGFGRALTRALSSLAFVFTHRFASQCHFDLTTSTWVVCKLY